MNGNQNKLYLLRIYNKLYVAVVANIYINKMFIRWQKQTKLNNLTV